MPITIDTTGLTPIETSAIQALEREERSRLGADAPVKTPKEFLTNFVRLAIEGWKEKYTTESIPDLEPLIKKLLNLTDAEEKEVLDKLAEVEARRPAATVTPLATRV